MTLSSGRIELFHYLDCLITKLKPGRPNRRSPAGFRALAEGLAEQLGSNWVTPGARDAMYTELTTGYQLWTGANPGTIRRYGGKMYCPTKDIVAALELMKEQLV